MNIKKNGAEKKILSYIATLNNRVAILQGNETLTYTELYKKILVYINEIEQSEIKQNQTVVLLADYSINTICVFLALYAYNIIIVPITSKKEEEVKTMLNQINANKIIKINKNGSIEIANTSFSTNNIKEPDLIIQLKEKKNAGLILFSSGISGKPKAMLHDFDKMVDSYPIGRVKSLKFILFLLFDHIGGINSMLQILHSGATMVLPEDRSPESIANLIEQKQVNILPTTPTFLNLLLISKVINKYNLESLKMITYGTEPMPISLLNRLRKEFPNIKFLQTFGTSETGISKTSGKGNDTLLKIIDNRVSHKIVNNELWIKSKTQIMGYLNHSNENFTNDGWFKTGDMVEQDAQGYFRIVGRFKEIINVGGEKVLPIEIESVLMKSEHIADCRVYGKSSNLTGQIVCSEIVVNDKSIPKQLIRKELKKSCNQHLSDYKVPSKFIFVENIPHNERFKKIKF